MSEGTWLTILMIGLVLVVILAVVVLVGEAMPELREIADSLERHE